MEKPSVKLLVRLFLIPLIIVAAAVGVMFLIGTLAAQSVSVEEALERLENPGGGRTAQVLVGPGAKQRYLDAKILVDKMKTGMTEAERIGFAASLTRILEKSSAEMTAEQEGEVRYFLLLALGRTWQADPHAAMDSTAARESRQRVVDLLKRYSKDPHERTRTAAVLAMVYLSGQAEARSMLPLLIDKVRDGSEDLDVRLAAATALGPLASPADDGAIAALHSAMLDSDSRNAELVWASAVSLAQLEQPAVADTILKLLDRGELAELRYYDRESDPANPVFRALNEQEQQRILINTMIGSAKLAKHSQVPAVGDRLVELSEKDPSPRVRQAGREILGGMAEK